MRYYAWSSPVAAIISVASIMIKTTSMLLSCMLAAFVVGCVNPSTVDRTGVEENNELQREFLDVHGDSTASAQAARIVGSPEWRAMATPELLNEDLRDAGLQAVYLPHNPRYPNDLYQAGWVRELKTLSSGASMREFLNSRWQRMAFQQADGTLYVLEGSDFLNLGGYSLEDAAKRVYGAQPYFGFDQQRYDRTTMLGDQREWPLEDPNDRGLRVERQYPTATVRKLDSQSYAEFERGLSREAYNEEQKRRYDALRAKRFGPNVDQLEGEVREQN